MCGVSDFFPPTSEVIEMLLQRNYPHNMPRLLHTYKWYVHL